MPFDTVVERQGRTFCLVFCGASDLTPDSHLIAVSAFVVVASVGHFASHILLHALGCAAGLLFTLTLRVWRTLTDLGDFDLHTLGCA